MARDPGAIWKPLTGKRKLPIIGPRVYVVHITAGRSEDSYDWYNGGPRPYPHFQTPRAGRRIQYKDTRWQAPAQLNLNPYAISNETVGLASDPFTDSQAEQVAESLAWAHKTHRIPLALTPDSRTDRRGVLTHRWGCRGNFPSTGLLRGLTQRGAGVLMSTSFGKICPTDSRIMQLAKEILPYAKQLAGGARGDDGEVISDEAKKWFRDFLAVRVAQEVDNRLGDLIRDAARAPTDPWEHPVARAMSDGSRGEKQPAREFLARTRLAAAMSYNTSQTLLARQQAIEALVTDMATRGGPLTAEQVQAIVEQALEEHLARVAAVISVEPGDG